MRTFRAMLVRIGYSQTMFTTVEADDEVQAINEVNTTWGSHYKLIHLGEVSRFHPKHTYEGC
jgi:hypothetical protein